MHREAVRCIDHVLASERHGVPHGAQQFLSYEHLSALELLMLHLDQSIRFEKEGGKPAGGGTEPSALR